MVYYWRCPALVKRYSAFPSFLEEARGIPYLRSHIESLSPQHKGALELILNDADADGSPRPVATMLESRHREVLARAFWFVHGIANHSHSVSLWVCFIVYAIGFALLAIVFLQNLAFVVRTTL
jgi:hypothetical protein